MSYMHNKKWLSLSAVLLITHPAYAEFEQYLETDAALIPDQSPLKSLSQLNSLKQLDSLNQLNHRQQYQAPFVQELNNTLQVRSLFVAAQDLPIVDIQLTFNAGSAQDETLGKGLFGMANMAARLMPEGTDQYTAKQLSTAFDALGAKFSVNAYRDMFTVRLRVLSDPQKLEPALALFLHTINHANFNQSGLNLVLSNTKVGQKQVQENPSRLMNIKFYRALYGQHPYAEPSVGTQASIKKISPAMLQQFRDQLLVAQNANIALTGNLSTELATQISEQISRSLKQGHKASEIIEPLEASDFNIQHIVHASSQAHVTIGHLGIRRDDPDRIALEVANRIFGGGSFNSLLSKELRVKRGYTYNASSNISAMLSRGVFSLSYATQQDQLIDSVRVAHQSLVDFIKKPISKNQLIENKEGILRAFPMTLSSNANINAQIASIGFYGLASDYLNQYQQQVDRLSTKDVERAIKKHLHADKLTIVVVSKELDQTLLRNALQLNLASNNTETRQQKYE